MHYILLLDDEVNFLSVLICVHLYLCITVIFVNTNQRYISHPHAYLVGIY